MAVAHVPELSLAQIGGPARFTGFGKRDEGHA
jgi:hypothetical protein